MFFVSLHSSGGVAVRETPVAYGPRHCAQKRSCGVDWAASGATMAHPSEARPTTRRQRVSVTASVYYASRVDSLSGSFDFQLRTRVIFGAGAIERLGEL